jgi:hypothetical protein
MPIIEAKAKGKLIRQKSKAEKILKELKEFVSTLLIWQKKQDKINNKIFEHNQIVDKYIKEQNNIDKSVEFFMSSITSYLEENRRASVIRWAIVVILQLVILLLAVL